MPRPPLPSLSDFPSQTFDKLRYGDTDRQGHINNAVFASLCETGRVSVLHAPGPLADVGCAFVIARLELNYHAELFWPGTVEIGTAVTAVGTSSITFGQGLFQNAVCAATGSSVVVQVNQATRRPQPLSTEARERLKALSGALLAPEDAP
jgi:acyl-CoA thioester hydrolase